MTTGLTERQQGILKAVRDLAEQNGYPPSLREVGAAVGLSSPSSVAYQLGVLQGAVSSEGAPPLPDAETGPGYLIPVIREKPGPPGRKGTDRASSCRRRLSSRVDLSAASLSGGCLEGLEVIPDQLCLGLPDAELLPDRLHAGGLPWERGLSCLQDLVQGLPVAALAQLVLRRLRGTPGCTWRRGLGYTRGGPGGSTRGLRGIQVLPHPYQDLGCGEVARHRPHAQEGPCSALRKPVGHVRPDRWPVPLPGSGAHGAARSCGSGRLRASRRTRRRPPRHQRGGGGRQRSRPARLRARAPGPGRRCARSCLLRQTGRRRPQST